MLGEIGDTGWMGRGSLGSLRCHVEGKMLQAEALNGAMAEKRAVVSMPPASGYNTLTCHPGHSSCLDILAGILSCITGGRIWWQVALCVCVGGAVTGR